MSDVSETCTCLRNISQLGDITQVILWYHLNMYMFRKHLSIKWYHEWYRLIERCFLNISDFIDDFCQTYLVIRYVSETSLMFRRYLCIQVISHKYGEWCFRNMYMFPKHLSCFRNMWFWHTGRSIVVISIGKHKSDDLGLRVYQGSGLGEHTK